MSDFYKLTNSTSDFNSRSKDVFDKLANLEKQHDVQAKSHTPIVVPDDDAAPSSQQNPVIPNNAIVFKKRPADDTFIRPTEKWQRYDLDDVNEHHLSSTGNQHALNDFFRTRAKPPVPKEHEKEVEEPVESTPIFKRPMKRQILTTDDDDDKPFIAIRAPLPSSTTKPKADTNDDDETIEYKLKSTRKKVRGVSSTSEKKPLKSSIEFPEEEKDHEEAEEGEDDINDELFEP